MDFATAVRDARTSSGLSQVALAAKALVSPHAVWELEARGNGTVDVLTSVCNALDLRFAGMGRGNAFGAQARALRLRRGWSQEKLAKKSGVSAPAILRLERGNARVATLRAVLVVLAPKARARKPEIANWGAGSRNERFTPPEVLDKLLHVFGRIDLDPCAHRASPVIATRCFYEEDDGLRQPWLAGFAYVNPPYSASAAFVRKAYAEWSAGQCATVALLLPVQTQHQVFHEKVVGVADVFFLRGRIAFLRLGKPRVIAPFGNKLVVFGADEALIRRVLAQFDCVHLPRTAAVGRAERRHCIAAEYDERGS